MNSSRTSHSLPKILSIIFFLALLSAYGYTFATPPGSPYQPAETLDPTCTPGSTNCFVRILPDQTGHAGEFLTTNGSTTSWAVGGGGSVSSFAFTDGNGFDGTVTNSTTTPTLTLTTQLTTGSVPFIGAGGALEQDAANLFWDNGTKRLGVGLNTPATALHLSYPGGQAAGLRVSNTTSSSVAGISMRSDGSSDTYLYTTGSTFSSGIIGANASVLSTSHPNGLFILSGGKTTFTAGGSTNVNVIMTLASSGNVGIGFGATSPAELLTIGNAGQQKGVISLSGNTSGKVIIQPQAAAGTYNFNLPTTAGTAGQILVSGGGGTSPMAWSSIPAFEAPLIFSTGLTRVSNTITNDLLTGISGGQTIIGSTSTTSGLDIKATTAAGTTGSHIRFLVGNNGATESARILSSGKFMIGATTDPGATASLVVGNVSAGGGLYSKITSNPQNLLTDDITNLGDIDGGNYLKIAGSNVDGSITYYANDTHRFVMPGYTNGLFRLNGGGVYLGDVFNEQNSTFFIVDDSTENITAQANEFKIGTTDYINGLLSFSNLDGKVYLGDYLGSQQGTGILIDDSMIELRFHGTSYFQNSIVINGVSPTALLTVTGSGTAAGLTAQFFNSLGASLFSVQDNGNTKIGSTSATDGFGLLTLQDTNSTCTFTANSGSPACGSDRTLKKDISSLDTALLLNKVSSLNPVAYHWQTEDSTAPLQYGFIAQEVALEFPDLVTQQTWIDGTTRNFLNTGGLMPYVVGALKEINIKLVSIDDLSKENTVRNSLIAWFANASNRITRIFTGEICLTDTDGTSECLNKQELTQLKQLLNTQNVQMNGSGSPSPTDPEPEITPDTSTSDSTEDPSEDVSQPPDITSGQDNTSESSG